MFCKNCGTEISDSTKFCSACGTAIELSTKTEELQSTVKKPKSKGKKIGGIVMTALGGLSVLGSFSNDYYWNIAHNGVNVSDLITIGIQIALIVVGVYLISKARKEN